VAAAVTSSSISRRHFALLRAAYWVNLRALSVLVGRFIVVTLAAFADSVDQ